MKQETYFRYDMVNPSNYQEITTVDTVCPKCREHIRFVVPDDISLRNPEEYCKSLREEIRRLQFELSKANELIRMSRGTK